jgi:Bacterial HORMA domain family 1
MTTYTYSETFTITHARHIASRIAGDLQLMSLFYGYPEENFISDLLEEIAQFLAKGYLKSFEIGFKRSGRRVFTLFYEAREDGSLSDNRAGGVPPNIEVRGASRFNYLTHSDKWWRLSQAEREAFESTLPVKRVSMDAPEDGSGYWVPDRSYAAGGRGVERKRFVPIQR